MKLWLIGSNDETWGIFTAENMDAVRACIVKEAEEFAKVIAPHMNEPLEYFTGSILEYELDTTEPLRYCNVTYKYADATIKLSDWYTW